MIIAHKLLSLGLKLVFVLFPLNVNKDNNSLHFEFLTQTFRSTFCK